MTAQPQEELFKKLLKTKEDYDSGREEFLGHLISEENQEESAKFAKRIFKTINSLLANSKKQQPMRLFLASLLVKDLMDILPERFEEFTCLEILPSYVIIAAQKPKGKIADKAMEYFGESISQNENTFQQGKNFIQLILECLKIWAKRPLKDPSFKQSYKELITKEISFPVMSQFFEMAEYQDQAMFSDASNLGVPKGREQQQQQSQINTGSQSKINNKTSNSEIHKQDGILDKYKQFWDKVNASICTAAKTVPQSKAPAEISKVLQSLEKELNEKIGTIEGDVNLILAKEAASNGQDMELDQVFDYQQKLTVLRQEINQLHNNTLDFDIFTKKYLPFQAIPEDNFKATPTPSEVPMVTKQQGKINPQSSTQQTNLYSTLQPANTTTNENNASPFNGNNDINANKKKNYFAEEEEEEYYDPQRANNQKNNNYFNSNNTNTISKQPEQQVQSGNYYNTNPNTSVVSGSSLGNQNNKYHSNNNNKYQSETYSKFNSSLFARTINENNEHTFKPYANKSGVAGGSYLGKSQVYGSEMRSEFKSTYSQEKKKPTFGESEKVREAKTINKNLAEQVNRLTQNLEALQSDSITRVAEEKAKNEEKGQIILQQEKLIAELQSEIQNITMEIQTKQQVFSAHNISNSVHENNNNIIMNQQSNLGNSKTNISQIPEEVQALREAIVAAERDLQEQRQKDKEAQLLAAAAMQQQDEEQKLMQQKQQQMEIEKNIKYQALLKENQELQSQLDQLSEQTSRAEQFNAQKIQITSPNRSIQQRGQQQEQQNHQIQQKQQQLPFQQSQTYQKTQEQRQPANPSSQLTQTGIIQAAQPQQLQQKQQQQQPQPQTVEYINPSKASGFPELQDFPYLSRDHQQQQRGRSVDVQQHLPIFGEFKPRGQNENQMRQSVEGMNVYGYQQNRSSKSRNNIFSNQNNQINQKDQQAQQMLGQQQQYYSRQTQPAQGANQHPFSIVPVTKNNYLQQGDPNNLRNGMNIYNNNNQIRQQLLYNQNQDDYDSNNILGSLGKDFNNNDDYEMHDQNNNGGYNSNNNQKAINQMVQEQQYNLKNQNELVNNNNNNNNNSNLPSNRDQIIDYLNPLVARVDKVDQENNNNINPQSQQYQGQQQQQKQQQPNKKNGLDFSDVKEGDRVNYDQNLFRLVEQYVPKINRFKASCLKSKYPIYDDPQLQVGIITQHITQSSGNYFKIQLYYTNKGMRPIKNLKLTVLDDPKDHQVHVSPDVIPEIEPKEQKKQDIVITYSYIPFSPCFVSINYSGAQPIYICLPNTVNKLFIFADITRDEFKKQFKERKYVNYITIDEINPKFAKTHQDLKLYLEALVDLNPKSEFDHMQGTAKFKMGLQFSLEQHSKDHNKEDFLLKIVCGTDKSAIVFVAYNDFGSNEKVKFILNTFCFLFSASNASNNDN